MSSLEKAIMLATAAHMGQKDKLGEDYILHPLTVMQSMKTEGEKIVAVLHDIVEDTNVTLADLKEEGFSEEILAAIDCITYREREEYLEYLNRVKQNEIAFNVKLADIKHNMSPERLKKLDLQTADKLMKKYELALRILSGERL